MLIGILFVFKGLMELGLMFMFGQAMLWMFLSFVPAKRSDNMVYSLFQVINKPWMGLAEWLAPRSFPERHKGLLAFGVAWSGYFLVLTLLMMTCSDAGLSIAECRSGR